MKQQTGVVHVRILCYTPPTVKASKLRTYTQAVNHDSITMDGQTILCRHVGRR